MGLKENITIGHFVPAGTGTYRYAEIDRGAARGVSAAAAAGGGGPGRGAESVRVSSASMAASDAPVSEPALGSLPQVLAGGLEIVAARALGDLEDARDVVQETLARALAAIRSGRVPPGTQLEAFVYGIARHVIADVLRRRARDNVAAADPVGLAAPGPSALEALIRAEERALLAKALAVLSSPERELLDLCFVQGERVSAIAARLGEPADRVRKRKSRALERLRAEVVRLAASGSHETPPLPTLTI